jgi:hypothetical protein
MEVGSGTRKKPIQTRLKLGWAICRVDDYIVVKDASFTANITTTSETSSGRIHVPCALGATN